MLAGGVGHSDRFVRQPRGKPGARALGPCLLLVQKAQRFPFVHAARDRQSDLAGGPDAESQPAGALRADDPDRPERGMCILGHAGRERAI